MTESTSEKTGTFSFGTWGVVATLFVLAAAIAVFAVWLVIDTITVLTSDADPPLTLDIFGWGGDLGREGLTLVLALSAGIVGGMIHFITSLAKYAGTKEFRRRWTIWYLARPVLGGLLAVVLYLVLRGGLLPSEAATDAVSPYGVAAIAGLAGMFSKQAIDWLERLFNNAFTRGEPLPDSLGGSDEESSG